MSIKISIFFSFSDWLVGPGDRSNPVLGLVDLVLNSLGYQDADTGAYTSLIVETTAASLAGAAICVGVIYRAYRLWIYVRSGCPNDDPLLRAFNLLGAASDTSSVDSYVGRFRRAESIPDFYAGVRRPMMSFNIHGRDETVEEDNISVRFDHVEARPRSRREDGAIPWTYSSQINPRSNDVYPGVQAVPVQVPVLAPVVLESVRIPPPPPVQVPVLAPVVLESVRIPLPPLVLESRSEDLEPEDVTGVSSFSQQILQAREKMVLRSSGREKVAKENLRE